MRNTRKIVYDFRGALSPPAVASRQGVWCSKAVAGGTIASVDGGSLDLAMTNTSEVQNLCLYMGDILPFSIDKLIAVEFIAKISASLAAAVTAVLGLGTARHDTPDSVAANAWFRLQGDNALLCETDDGTTDKDDIATGLTLAATYRRLRIDFSEGIQTRQAPSVSLGGKSNVIFSAEDSRGALKRVAANTLFDMSASTSNLQLLAQIQKTTGTAVGTLSILEASVEYKVS